MSEKWDWEVRNPFLSCLKFLFPLWAAGVWISLVLVTFPRACEGQVHCGCLQTWSQEQLPAEGNQGLSPRPGSARGKAEAGSQSEAVVPSAPTGCSRISLPALPLHCSLPKGAGNVEVAVFSNSTLMLYIIIKITFNIQIRFISNSIVINKFYQILFYIMLFLLTLRCRSCL